MENVYVHIFERFSFFIRCCFFLSLFCISLIDIFVLSLSFRYVILGLTLDDLTSLIETTNGRKTEHILGIIEVSGKRFKSQRSTQFFSGLV